MTYLAKFLLLGFLTIYMVLDCHDINCDDLMENIVYDGVFYDGVGESVLASPFLENVTAYYYDEAIYVISKDRRGELSIYCKVSQESWEAFSAKCSDCSYSKKFDENIGESICDCKK